MTALLNDTRSVTYELEIPVDAPTASVWDTLTTNIEAWWLHDFHMAGPGSEITLDATAGGLLVERAPGGGSLLWYTVQMVLPGSTLHLVGHIAPDWGGPTTSILTLSVEERDGRAVLKIRDALVGCVTEESAAQQRDGWRQLFTDGFKAHVESRA